MPRLPRLLAMPGALFISVVLFPSAVGAQIAIDDARVAAPSSALTSQFGAAFDVDGDLMIVGAPLNDSGETDAGRAYVFRRDALGVWQLEQELAPTVPIAAGRFGYGVGVAGERIVVTETRSFDDENDFKDGRAFVYEQDPEDGWVVVAALDPVGLEHSGNTFGDAVAFDGERLAIGATRADIESFVGGGVYVYVRSSAGVWEHEDTVTATFFNSLSEFGAAVALHGDRMVVGAPWADSLGNRTGSVVVYGLFGSDWIPVQHLTASVPLQFSNYGSTVAFEGDRIAVGMPVSLEKGEVYVYDRLPNGTWVEGARLLPEVGSPPAFYGTSVTFAGERLLIGRVAATSPRVIELRERDSGGTWERVVRFAPEALPTSTGFGEVVRHDDGIVYASRPSVNAVNRDIHVFELATLYRDENALSTAAGGNQTLQLRAGEAHAGELFVVLGSLSGTAPALLLDVDAGIELPLVVDEYTTTLVEATGAGFVDPWAALLDDHGRADVEFTLPPSIATAFAGLTLHHAYLTFELSELKLTFASDAAALELLP
jgi:hypothetical protein